jgi:hypothetical protein
VKTVKRVLALLFVAVWVAVVAAIVQYGFNAYQGAMPVPTPTPSYPSANSSLTPQQAAAINAVPLVRDTEVFDHTGLIVEDSGWLGILGALDKDHPYGWSIVLNGATLVEMERDEATGELWLCLAFAGPKLTEVPLPAGASSSVTNFDGSVTQFHDYRGLSAWVKLPAKVTLSDFTERQLRRYYDADTVMGHFQVGMLVSAYVSVDAAGDRDGRNAFNIAALAKVQGSLGKPNNRTDKAFVFIPYQMYLVESQFASPSPA